MKILAIDANNILSRAFYAIPYKKKEGETPKNGIMGFMNMMIRAVEDHSPDCVVACFDVHAPTFRHKMYADYKAGRHKQPDDLTAQFPVLKELLRKIDVTVLESPGFEADDLLGTVAKKNAEHKFEKKKMYRNPNHRYPPFTLRQSLQLSETLIMSGDRDVLQLINNTTNVLLQLNKSSKTIDNFYNCARMLNEYNIAPNYFVQLKALMGDNSDNIKGAIGFGEKTALTMIKTYKTIDNIYNHLSDLKPKQRESMEEFRSRYQQNLELVRIKCDVPILPVLTPFKQDNRVAEVFKAYGLHSLSERISKISGEMEQLSWF